MKSNQILQISAQAGRIVLENGGETYRVEETARRICHALGAAQCQCYASPTAIMLSVTDSSGQVHSIVERINARGINLDKIDAVNRFSRQLERERPDLERAAALLQHVKQRRSYSFGIILLFSALAAGAFSIVFEGGLRDFFCAALTGGLIRLGTVLMQRFALNDFFINIVGGAIASLTGWLTVLLGLGQNMDIIIISALMLLVPGLIITNAVRDIAAGDLISGISRTMEAFFVAIAIACGTALSHALISMWGGQGL